MKVNIKPRHSYSTFLKYIDISYIDVEDTYIIMKIYGPPYMYISITFFYISRKIRVLSKFTLLSKFAGTYGPH